MLNSFHIFVNILALTHLVRAIGSCYTPGPAFPPIDRVLNKTHYVQLKVKLGKLISNVLENPNGWTTNTTSFAIQVTSSEETIWDYFYTAPILNKENARKIPVDGDTAFRVASVSKSFTVYAILLEDGIGLDDPITKYIPELLHGTWPDGPNGAPTGLLADWESITIRSLASQLGGIMREGGLSDLAVDTALLPDPTSKGFPPVIEQLLHPCMKNSTDRACNASEIIATARKRPRVFTTNARSTYSNVGFSLLGIILERATGKTYFEVISSSILKPLGMVNTRTTKPKDTDGIIPYGPNDWAQDLGADSPSGGIYCTTNDFSKYLRSILSSELLPQATINAWMKPHSWTSGNINSAYGMPWEILRTAKLTPDGRAIDIITKGGALTQYFSIIALLPEFGLGITILIAGDHQALSDVQEKVISTLVPATEKLIRDEVRRVYAGIWAADEDIPDSKWSLKLEVDETGPGLRVADWTSNGTDFLSVYGSLKNMPSDPSQWQARLIPSGLYREPLTVPNAGSSEQYWETGVWRLTAVPRKNSDNERLVFDEACYTDVDSLMYDGYSVEEFVISTGRNGKTGLVEGVFMSIPGMQTSLWRLDEDGARISEYGVIEKLPGSPSEQQELMTFY